MNHYQPLVKQAKQAVIATAVAVALASSAQQQEPVRENANRPQVDQSTQVARSDTGLQTLEQYLGTKPLRVSKLVGMEVQNRGGDNLGEVHEVARASMPGGEMQLIVQVGGIGEPEKLIGITFDEIQISANGEELYTNRTREQLAASPAVILDQRTAGNAAPAPRSTDADRGAAPGGAQPRSTAPTASGSTAPASLGTQRIADLIGAEVIDSGGDPVGEVDDIVISTAGADSVRAVLQVGGVAGVGEKRISLPLGELTVERAAGSPTLRVAMNLESLERLPEFEYEEQTSAL
jgi:sporulation protein YlmC with PRC-barrel domain